MGLLHRIKYFKVKTVWVFLASAVLIYGALALYLYFRPYQFNGGGVVVTAAFPNKPLEKKIDNRFGNSIVSKEQIYVLNMPDRVYYLYISEIKEKVLINFPENVLLDKYINQLTLIPSKDQASIQPSFYNNYAGVSIFYTSIDNVLSGQIYLSGKAMVGIFVIENGSTPSNQANMFVHSLGIREATQLSDVF